MTYDIVLALAAFAFVSSITPGPNNLMLMASGANFGVRRTLPHMLGVGMGFVFMTILVGAGVMGLLEAFPALEAALMTACVAYLLYLAWKIATAAPPDCIEAKGKPFTFLQAAGFQWVNPKAWAMALTAMSVYAPMRDWPSILLVALVFGAVNLPSISCWVALGKGMRRLLARPGRLRAFNVTMAALLVGTLIPVFLH